MRLLVGLLHVGRRCGISPALHFVNVVFNSCCILLCSGYVEPYSDDLFCFLVICILLYSDDLFCFLDTLNHMMKLFYV